jgi:hypothetical protein
LAQLSVVTFLAIASLTTAACAPGDEKPVAIKVDFFVNPGAFAESDTDKATAIGRALDELNDKVKGAGIKFESGTIEELPKSDNVKPMPASGGPDTASEEQKKAADEARAAEKKLAKPGRIVVKIVQNFAKGDNAQVNGITIGDVIVIADPDGIAKNSMGGQSFAHTLAHELGHRLGLKHQLEQSDKNDEGFKDKTKDGRYAPPNLMAPDGAKDDWSLTADQIEALKAAAAKLLK